MLRYTGAVADGWLKNRGWPESTDELQGYVAVLEQQGAEKAGRDPGGIRRVLNGAAGADTFHLAFPAASRHDDMRRFAEEVLPAARRF